MWVSPEGDETVRERAAVFGSVRNTTVHSLSRNEVTVISWGSVRGITVSLFLTLPVLPKASAFAPLLTSVSLPTPVEPVAASAALPVGPESSLPT